MKKMIDRLKAAYPHLPHYFKETAKDLITKLESGKPLSQWEQNMAKDLLEMAL